jgi:hypothetical protein
MARARSGSHPTGSVVAGLRGHLFGPYAQMAGRIDYAYAQMAGAGPYAQTPR